MVLVIFHLIPLDHLQVTGAWYLGQILDGLRLSSARQPQKHPTLEALEGHGQPQVGSLCQRGEHQALCGAKVLLVVSKCGPHLGHRAAAKLVARAHCGHGAVQAKVIWTQQGWF